MNNKKEKQEITPSSFRKDDQLAASGELTCAVVSDAVEYLTEFTEKLKELKKTANFISWKLQEIQKITKVKTIPHECSQTGANGFCIPGIAEVYYDIDQAAHFLSITTQSLAEKATSGEAYFLQIGCGTYFPERVLRAINTRENS